MYLDSWNANVEMIRVVACEIRLINYPTNIFHQSLNFVLNRFPAYVVPISFYKVTRIEIFA